MYYLNSLGALFVNGVVPGAGYIMAGYYRIGIAIQAFLAGSLVISCWTRWILTPVGCKTLLAMIALTYLLNTLCLIVIISKATPSWTIKNALISLMFCMLCLAAFAYGFTSKEQWLGIHINFVPSGSMQPTLLPGDFILVDHWHYKHYPVDLDDIVVFKLPRHNDLTVKRVSPWLDQKIIHEDRFYLLGDNKRHSHDSRAFGGIAPEWMRGKVELILFSFDSRWRWRKQRVFKSVY